MLLGLPMIEPDVAPDGVGEIGIPSVVSDRRRRRIYTSFGCVALLGLLSYGLVDDLLTQVRLHHAQGQLATTRDALDRISRQLGAAQKSLGATITAKTTKQTTLTQLSAELSLANEDLAQGRQGLELQHVNIATLDSCVMGVQQAVMDLQAGEQQSAISTIGGVAAPCENLHGNNPSAAAYPFDFPDPDVIDVGGTYYAYGTNSAGGNIQIIESNDLSHWKTVGDALPKPASWTSTGYIWAPGVLRHRGQFLLYYATVSGSGLGSKQCISVARARHPGGPFVDSSIAPLICQASLGGSIDPAPYTDGSGKLYLTWKSNGGGGHPSTIWAEALSRSGTTIARHSSPTAILVPSQSWEASVVEGPFMWSSKGSYYLFYSGNNWNSGSYAIGVAVCRGPLGPCAKPLTGPFYASQPNLAGPGGASVFRDPRGNAWIAFHAWLPDAVGYPNARLLFVRPLASLGSLP